MTSHLPRRSPNWRMIVAVVVLAIVWLAMLYGGTGPLDRSIYEALYAGKRPVMASVARVFTALGDPTVLVAIGFVVALWFWWRGHLRLGVAVLAVTLLGRGLAEVQKYEIARLRPALEPHLVVVKTSSFPSGHATSSMIVGLTLALALTRGTPWTRAAVAVAILLSLLIGLSRVVLGVHWPSDVIGGWSFGMLWVLLTWRPAERLLHADSVGVRTAL
jgi:undecaprenyl-diphosphatase